MKRGPVLFVLFAAVFSGVGQAQERLTCGEYLQLAADAKPAAIDGVGTLLTEAGQGYRFEADDSAETKVTYVDAECTSADAWAGLALFDVLGK